MEANQPIDAGEVSQQDRSNATIVQALILAMGAAGLLGGLLGILPGYGLLGLSSLLAVVNWGAAIAVIVLFFMWKDKGEFMYGHLRQALGLVLLSLVVSIALTIVGVIVGAIVGMFVVASAPSAMALATGVRAVTPVVLIVGLLGMAVNAVFAWFGYQGMQAAQKGQSYLYPYVGEFIANFGKK